MKNSGQLIRPPTWCKVRNTFDCTSRGDLGAALERYADPETEVELRGPGRHLAPQEYPSEAAHHGIAVSGGTVCDAGTISNYVALVSLSTGRVRRIINVGERPGEALTSLDGTYCFVTNRGPTGLDPPNVAVAAGDSVSAIDYQTGAVRTIAVGRHPQAETTALIPTAVLRAGGFLR